MKQRQPALLGRILKRIAPKIGAKVYLEPQWNVVGQIVFKNGRKRYFRFSSLDLNPLGASEISKDKDFATYFMKRMGYRTIPGYSFFSDDWCEAIGSKQNIHAGYQYAQKIGLPVIVKPNSRTQGIGVTKVYTKQEFYKAAKFIFTKDKVALVQPALSGKDYRVVVLDKKVISAYQRVPLSITGNGKSTIRQLLTSKQLRFIKEGRDTKIKMDDFRILQNIRRQHLKLASKLKKGQHIFLLDNANLSSGGDATDVTEQIHPGFKKLTTQLTKDMGLRLCGVDLLIDGDISNPPKKYWILETNAAPGLDHYANSGKKQAQIVEAMYAKVLKAME